MCVVTSFDHCFFLVLFCFDWVAIHIASCYFVKMIMKSVVVVVVDHILHRIIFEDVRSTVMCKIHLSKHFLNLVCVYLTNRQVVDLLCVACFCVIDI